jgi:hypothetical protein
VPGHQDYGREATTPDKRRMWFGRAITLVLCAGLSPALIAGCRDSATPARAEAAAPPAVASTTPEQSPADVAAQLQALHRERDYARIAELVVEDCRAACVELLEAIDGVLDANAALRKTAEQRYRSPLTETWSLAAMEDNIGPFSNRVRLIGQQFKGDTAAVTLQAGDNIPLIHAAFERVGGRWQYRPDPSPAKLTAELCDLARTLRDVENAVERGTPFESYLDAFYYRVLPQMVAVVTARDDPNGKADGLGGRRVDSHKPD